MRPAELENRMRELEYFRPLRLLPGAWAILRVDGRGFHRFTGGRFEKPFDERFRDLMTATAGELLRQLQGLYAYTMSDEISLLLPRHWDLFGRRLEKAVSVSAGIASAVFTRAAGEAAHFDSRVWVGTAAEEVVDYFLWRQLEAARNALHGWCFWRLRRSGQDVAEATERLRRCSWAEQNELLFRHGINFNDLPLWQRRGAGVYWETVEKEGRDPRTGEPAVAIRSRLKVDLELPMKEGYAALLRRIIEES